ncbi:MAG: nucleoside triphosphate pyrophosphohydrolase [Clostridiales bacterium]|nr:nucleoside triphosphate pyrophosphohydrolase [Clostridiales bacterium]
MSVDYCFKDKYNINDLLEIMKILRAPGGCPWDAEQDHQSIKKSFIEETYEVIEAINKDDKDLLCEELGDVLLQVVFHAEIENEKGVFDFDDVCDGICKKLIVRHPHVFGNVVVGSSDEVLSNWDDIKRKTKNQKTSAQAMSAVPRELPALMRCQKIQSKAVKNGVDVGDDASLSAYISDKAAAAEACLDEKSIGELLFAAVAAARKKGIDAEEALTKITDKFADDFAALESSSLNAEEGRQSELYK